MDLLKRWFVEQDGRQVGMPGHAAGVQRTSAVSTCSCFPPRGSADPGRVCHMLRRGDAGPALSGARVEGVGPHSREECEAAGHARCVVCEELFEREVDRAIEAAARWN
jgi:hypothetical protein